jgi:uncharacterized protein YdaU (DUF1376 family)
MAELPSMPLWTDAYLADTSDLTTLEHGAYLLLLMAMWRAGGSLPNDPQRLARFARLTKGQWERVWRVLERFFRIEDDQLFQNRLTDELNAVRRRSTAASDSARAKWRKNKEAGSAPALPNRCEAAATIPITRRDDPSLRSGSSLSAAGADVELRKPKGRAYPQAFEAAWSAYPTDRNMSKSEAFEAWRKLDDKDRETLMASIPAFRTWCGKNPDYRVIHMNRYIKYRRFDGHAGAHEPPVVEDERRWRTRLDYARDERRWSTPAWGPMPGRNGSRVPAQLLAPGDGEGWAEFEGAR